MGTGGHDAHIVVIPLLEDMTLDFQEGDRHNNFLGLGTDKKELSIT
jgi:hypothetical protein